MPGEVQGRLLPHGQNGSHQGPGKASRGPSAARHPRPAFQPLPPSPAPSPRTRRGLSLRRTLSGGTLPLTCRPPGSAGGNRRERGRQPACLSFVCRAAPVPGTWGSGGRPWRSQGRDDSGQEVFTQVQEERPWARGLWLLGRGGVGWGTGKTRSGQRQRLTGKGALGAFQGRGMFREETACICHSRQGRPVPGPHCT